MIPSVVHCASLDMAILSVNPISPGGKTSLSEAYLPAAQLVQVEAPALEILPAAQLVQTKAPSSENLPLVQTVHLSVTFHAAVKPLPLAELSSSDANCSLRKLPVDL
jgi:hypothetical protein